MRAEGKLDGLGWDSYVFFGKSVPWNTSTFTGEELAVLRARIFRNFYFRPAYIARKFMAIRSFRELRHLAKGALAAFRFTGRG